MRRLKILPTDFAAKSLLDLMNMHTPFYGLHHFSFITVTAAETCTVNS